MIYIEETGEICDSCDLETAFIKVTILGPSDKQPQFSLCFECADTLQDMLDDEVAEEKHNQ